MIPETNYWLRRLGFYVWHVPGVSRAWRLEFDHRGHILVTDIDGYDLPDLSGPFLAVALSSSDELIDTQTWLADTNELFNWVEGALQLCDPRTKQFERTAEAIQAFRRWEDRRVQMQSFLSNR